jgi:uncharacterized membrane protein
MGMFIWEGGRNKNYRNTQTDPKINALYQDYEAHTVFFFGATIIVNLASVWKGKNYFKTFWIIEFQNV